MRVQIGGCLLAVFAFSLAAAEGDSKNREQEKASPAFKIDKSVPIEMLFGSYHNVIDLGVLPCGVSGLVNIRLTNPHNATFDIKQIELGCKCTSAKISKTNIDSGGETLLTVGLDTPESSRNRQRTHSLKLVTEGGEKNDIHIALRYQLSGLMCFVGGAHVIEVAASEDRQAVPLPFLLTDPIKKQDILLEFVPDNPGVIGTIVEDKGKHYVKVEFDTVFVPEEGLSLTVYARHKSKELEDSIPLLLSRRKRIEVTPRTLRFKTNGDELQAKCLLRYRSADPKGTEDASNSERQSVTISAEARIGKMKARVTSRRLGAGIYRLTVSVPSKDFHEHLEAENPPSSVRWNILASDKSYAIESRFVVDSIVRVSVPSN